MSNTTIKIKIGKKDHIDVTPPVTGAKLYQLGEVANGYDLWKEVHGQDDDIMIANNQDEVSVHNGDKFYTAQSSLNPGYYGSE